MARSKSEESQRVRIAGDLTNRTGLLSHADAEAIREASRAFTPVGTVDDHREFRGRLLRDGGPVPGNDDLAEMIASHVEVAVLDRSGTPTDASLRELTRDRVKRYIDVNLDDPLLSLDRVAAAIGCTKRYLHKLFDGEAETLNAYIWQTRLQRIRHDLADPALKDCSITEIAFSRGFSS